MGKKLESFSPSDYPETMNGDGATTGRKGLKSFSPSATVEKKIADTNQDVSRSNPNNSADSSNKNDKETFTLKNVPTYAKETQGTSASEYVVSLNVFDDDVGARTATINGASVSAAALRACEIVGADGTRAPLGRATSGAPNVVVVLRHLA